MDEPGVVDGSSGADELARAILDSALDAIVLADETGSIVSFNPAAEALFGLERAAVLGRTIGETLVPEHLRRAHDEGMRRHLETGMTRIMGRRVEMEARHASGRVLPVELAVTEVRAKGRRLFAAHIRSLGPRGGGEAALFASEARFRSIVEDQTEFISRFTPDFTLTFINRAYAEQLGRPREALLGSCLLDLMTPEQQRRFKAQLADLSPERSVVSYEMETILRDGTPGIEHWTDRALFDEAGVLVEYQSVGRDVTELRRASAEIQRQREILHQSEKLAALGSLLAGVAHELNNPLSVVLGRAALLQETVQDPAVLTSIGKLRDAAERCARVVRTFVAMARQEPREPSVAEAGELIERALALLGYGLTSGGIEVVLDVDPDLPPLFGDVDQLQQLMVNLIVNAQQALIVRDPPRRLWIEAKVRSGQLEVTVADNGPGVPDAIKHRIFEPFFTTKPQGLGTGIGLAFCHSIAAAHGGTITVEDRPGGGALFRTRLPFAHPNVAPPRRRPAPAGSPGRPARILVIDDEEDVVEMLGDILRLDGHEVIGATRGADALALVDDQPVDLVISDYRMADLDGRGVYAGLKQRRPDLARHLIFSTGDSLSPDIREFLAQTGCACLDKPFAPSAVRRLVQEHLGRQKG